MEPYDERYDEYYRMPPPSHGHPMQRSRSAPRYPHERPPPPQDPNYYGHYGTARAHSQPRQQYPPHPQHHHPHQQQYYDDHGMEMAPPPLPPHKKKKSVLKSPLVALKNALIKSTRPLRRMNSMVEPERKPKGLRRQQSMLERGVQRPYYPDEYPTYPAGFEERSHGMMPPHPQDGYYQQRNGGHYPQHPQDMMNSTYQNLESEDIYGNIGGNGTVPRMQHPHDNGYDQYDQYDLYANRACIDLERRQAEAAAAAAASGGKNGRRIVRRHSTTTADRGGGNQWQARRPVASPGYEQDPQEIYQTRNGAYMLPQDQRRAPNSEVMTRRRFYPGAANEEEPLYQSRREMQREMQRNHLYQSKREMQERISQGKRDMEREFSPQSSSSQSEASNPEAIYQSRREAKESALKTRSQLRDQIYQTRREALDSMAEPIYVSKRDMGRPAPIYETREESILQSRENETDEKKEGKTEQILVEINTQPEDPVEVDSTLSRSDLQKSSDTVIENPARAPLVKAEVDEVEESQQQDEEIPDESSVEAPEQVTAIENNHHNEAMMLASETQNESDDVFEAADQVAPLAPPPAPMPVQQPLTPRSGRAPFHISNILKRTAPPPSSPIGDSCTSIETQYTSQASLPVGPPNATSTPFSSNMSLPIAGPVNNAPPQPTNAGPFPAIPREPSTSRGFFDSNGGTLADKLWHVSLQIPPGAIPPGVRQEIYFTVSDPRMGQAVGGPPLDMENGWSN